jgi:hypothetical protein
MIFEYCHPHTLSDLAQTCSLLNDSVTGYVHYICGRDYFTDKRAVAFHRRRSYREYADMIDDIRIPDQIRTGMLSLSQRIANTGGLRLQPAAVMQSHYIYQDIIQGLHPPFTWSVSNSLWDLIEAHPTRRSLRIFNPEVHVCIVKRKERNRNWLLLAYNTLPYRGRDTQTIWNHIDTHSFAYIDSNNRVYPYTNFSVISDITLKGITRIKEMAIEAKQCMFCGNANHTPKQVIQGICLRCTIENE